MVPPRKSAAKIARGGQRDPWSLISSALSDAPSLGAISVTAREKK
jgi:hypothetical protein